MRATLQPTGLERTHAATRPAGRSEGHTAGLVKGTLFTLASYKLCRDNMGVLRPLLQAHWSHLCVISYAVPPELLQAHIPRGLTLDMRDGHAFVSLVAFASEDTRLRGIAWPFHRHYPEVSLRFYVRGRGGERGIVPIRDFVPKRLVSWLTRRTFREPCECTSVTSHIHPKGNGLEVIYRFRHHERWQEIAVATTREAPLLPPEDGPESFFLDPPWGFCSDGDGHVLRYRIMHPRWLCYRIEWAEVRVNWGKTYGQQWKILDHAKPSSAILAEGSDVALFPATAA
jgi:uncharacterized protein YqjF (DUF2071 family)